MIPEQKQDRQREINREREGDRAPPPTLSDSEVTGYVQQSWQYHIFLNFSADYAMIHLMSNELRRLLFHSFNEMIPSKGIH